MKKKSSINILAIFVLVSTSCNFITNSFNTMVDSANSGNDIVDVPGSVSSNGFSAETIDGNVLLQWEPILDTEKYLLEFKAGDNYLPFATFPAEQNSFLDENVPSDTVLTYRLSSLQGSQVNMSKEITVKSPPDEGEPLQVSLEFDQSSPEFDMENFDPSSIDPSNFDPENFDPSSFVPLPIKSEKVIGPKGGEISVTSSSGIVYTLTIPPDSLRFEVPVRLSPISSIPDLPLSGGLTAAVLIEPESLIFDVPATLSMTPPDNFPDPSAPLVAAFAFNRDGTDFHLFPLAPSNTTSEINGGIHTASLIQDHAKVPPGSDIAQLQNGGGYGQGNGTVEDIQQIKKHPPSESGAKTAQQMAANQMEESISVEKDDLVPLATQQELYLSELGKNILDRMNQAGDLTSLMDAISNFNDYINSGARESEYLNGLTLQILDAFLKKANEMLKKNKNECLTPDDIVAKELIEKLADPKSNFSKVISKQYIKRYGRELLDELAMGYKNCTYELSLNSTLTFTAAKSTLHASANSVDKIKLTPRYSEGRIVLQGAGIIKEKLSVSGVCPFPLQQYDKLIITIELTPVFEGKVLKDFSLENQGISGWTDKVSASSNGKFCLATVTVSGGGDYWSGLYTNARIALGNPFPKGWKITNQLNSGGSLQAHWESIVASFQPLGVEALMSEDTKFDLVVKKNKK